MDIKKLQMMKKELEQDISNLLSEFMVNTEGVIEIQGINLTPIQENNKVKPVMYLVEIDLHL